MKIVTISTAHSSNATEKDQKITLKLNGGSPWFNYLWIDDVCYTIRKHDTGRVFQIQKTK